MPLDLSKLPKVGEKLPVHRRESDKSVINVTYHLEDELGHGAFGAVYKGKCEEDGTEVAIKCEPFECKKKMLEREFTVIRLGYCSGSPYFTKYGERGVIAHSYVYITMQLVDTNLWDLVKATKGKGFSINTSMRVAIQTLAAVRDLHEINYIHRDIKPANFAVGKKEKDTNRDSIIYMLDFGMCRRLRVRGKHTRPRCEVRFRGTTRYSSVGALELKDQSRKDDVESWFYMVLEFTSGNVPWNHCTDRNETLKVKKEFRNNEPFFAYLNDCPVHNEFRKILTYIDSMTYFSIPHYDGLHSLLFKVPERMGLRETEPLDWSPRREYVPPDWNRSLYVKIPDVYCKGDKKERQTASEESSEDKGDGSRNENESEGIGEE